MPGSGLSLIVTTLGWALGLVLALVAWQHQRALAAERKRTAELQRQIAEAEAARNTAEGEAARLRDALGTSKSEAEAWSAALGNLNAHLERVTVTNTAVLDALRSTLAAHLSILKDASATLETEQEKLRAGIADTRLVDKKSRLSGHLQKITDCEPDLAAAIPRRENDLAILEAFIACLSAGRFDEAFEAEIFDKVKIALAGVEGEKARVLRERWEQPSPREVEKARNAREETKKSDEQRRLEAENKAQKARSILDDPDDPDD